MGETVRLQVVQVVVPRHGGGGVRGEGGLEESDEVGAMSRFRSEQNKNGKTAVESLGRAVEAKARLAQAGRLTRVRERGEGGRAGPEGEEGGAGGRGRRRRCSAQCDFRRKMQSLLEL